ncbi:unnamed protein product [Oppiella nova]|uniref:NR LBD domain-containing protein n=1 Tax=Oppiella nova TaxID=334625 RepID=A0A7R9QGQ4_9ACAR|nr:unnamed protein product [Oppiella nova]CAG2165393.1 unnamed protein product [Oppiella nova]
MIAELENYSTFKSNAKSEDNNSLSDNMTIIPIFRELNDYNGLNELESNRINELMSASHVFSAQLTQNTRHIKSLEEWMRHSVELNEKSIKDMASFITKLNGFTNICPDDQLALFKYGYNELTCIYYCKYYIRESDCFLVPLLKAIILFNPNRPNLSHKLNVK